MDKKVPVILCQPDSRKGCSVCCGLFNLLDCREAVLSSFLEKGCERSTCISTYDQFILADEVRDKYAHVCPYQGFIGTGRPGCHIHPLSSGTEDRDRSLFSRKICSSFLCPAHVILSDHEKEALIKHVNHWYLYSIAIADPETFSCLLEHITETYNLNSRDYTAGLLLNTGLEAHALELAKSSETLFHYSHPEYILHREEFCIRYNKKRREIVLGSVEKTANREGITA